MESRKLKHLPKTPTSPSRQLALRLDSRTTSIGIEWAVSLKSREEILKDLKLKDNRDTRQQCHGISFETMQRAANTHVDIVELAVMMRSEDGEAVWRGHPGPESVGWLGDMSCGSVLTALGLTKHGPTIVHLHILLLYS